MERVTKWLMGKEWVQCGYKGMICVPGWMECDGSKFHHATQKGMYFKMDELLVSGILHLIFSDCGWLQIMETEKSETADKGGVL